MRFRLYGDNNLFKKRQQPFCEIDILFELYMFTIHIYLLRIYRWSIIKLTNKKK